MTDLDLTQITAQTVEGAALVILTLPPTMGASHVDTIRDHVMRLEADLGVRFMILGGGVEGIRDTTRTIALHAEGLARALGYDPATLTFAPVSRALERRIERATIEVVPRADVLVDFIITPAVDDDGVLIAEQARRIARLSAELEGERESAGEDFDHAVERFNPSDDDSTTLQSMIDTAVEALEATPCSCPPGAQVLEADPCSRCRALGRAGDVVIAR